MKPTVKKKNEYFSGILIQKGTYFFFVLRKGISTESLYISICIRNSAYKSKCQSLTTYTHLVIYVLPLCITNCNKITIKNNKEGGF